MDLVIERFRRQDAIPLPCKRSWRTIVDVLCDAFEAVEKMDLVIEHNQYRRSSKSLVEGRSTLNLEKRFPVATQGQPAAKLYSASNSSGGTTFAFAMKHRKQLLVQARLSICAM